MWYFRSPEIVFGEGALEHLYQLRGRRAFIVTDPMMVKLGFVEHVGRHLQRAGLEYQVFSEVEPEPSVETIHLGAGQMTAYAPDWIIGLGGGSAMDAAKAMWVLYEQPDSDIEGINPTEPMVLRQKARLIAIPTTSGTGSEATWATVLTNVAEKRKVGVGTPEMLPDVAIVDPFFPSQMPPRLTADTGLDALSHAVEGYTATCRNDFSDGLCLKALELIFNYLPRAMKDGQDREAREKLHNASTMAGLGFSNSMAALAHSLGHSLGAIFHIPHGRAVALFLPYTIQFVQNGSDPTRYYELSRFLGLPAGTPAEGTASFLAAMQDLYRTVGQPMSVSAGLNISPADYEAALDDLVAHAEADTVIAASPRIPSTEETYKLFQYAYTGQSIDF